MGGLEGLGPQTAVVMIDPLELTHVPQYHRVDLPTAHQMIEERERERERERECVCVSVLGIGGRKGR